MSATSARLSAGQGCQSVRRDRRLQVAAVAAESCPAASALASGPSGRVSAGRLG